MPTPRRPVTLLTYQRSSVFLTGFVTALGLSYSSDNNARAMQSNGYLTNTVAPENAVNRGRQQPLNVKVLSAQAPNQNSIAILVSLETFEYAVILGSWDGV